MRATVTQLPPLLSQSCDPLQQSSSAARSTLRASHMDHRCGTQVNDTQKDLPLPCPPLPGDLPLLPARMINEYQYCPRLAYLEWVQGEWSDSVDTVEGRHVHRRVDRPRGDLPRANGKTHSLSSPIAATSSEQPASGIDTPLAKTES